MLPNFLIIGAAKSGTTSLYHYLEQHPQIYMSPMKGPRFFAMEGETPAFCGPQDAIVNERTVTELEDYLSLFASVKDEKASGEATDWYLSSEQAVDRIRHYIPHARLIAILRHPAERAFSSYMHFARHGYEPLFFEDALAAEEERMRKGWSPLFQHKGRGFYGSQLKRYFDVFDRQQISVHLYDDLKNDAVGLVRDLYKFLNVDPGFTPDTTVLYNKSGTPRHQLLHRLLHRPSRAKRALKLLLPSRARKYVKAQIQNRNLVEQTMPASVRERLTAEYHADILQLQDLINRDLGHWLTSS